MSFTNDKDTDNYSTNKAGWESIKEYIPNDKIIWSPFYNDGKQKEYFKEMGFNIIHEDEDFFLNNKGEIVIDNPPFSKRALCLKRLKELGKPFILVLPSGMITNKWFCTLFKNDLQIIIPKDRPTFSHLNNGKTKYTPPLGTYYYCWKMNLEKDIIWLN